MTTGEEYKESSCDGRSEFFEGERVDDLIRAALATTVQGGGGLDAQRIVTRTRDDPEGAKQAALHVAGPV